MTHRRKAATRQQTFKPMPSFYLGCLISLMGRASDCGAKGPWIDSDSGRIDFSSIIDTLEITQEIA